MIADFRTRLTSLAVPPLRYVSGAAQVPSAAQDVQRQRMPEAFVLPLAAQGGLNQVATGVTQKVTARVGVLIGVSTQGERRGETAVEDVEPIYQAVRSALVGWTPDAALGQVLFARGAVAGIGGGVFWWLEEFNVPELIQV